MKKRIRGVLLAGTLAIAAGGVAVVATTMANAATGQICEQYGTTVQGNYIVQNNRWGTSATQCINVTNNGFQITQQDGTGNLSGAPVSYPSIYLGCHYSNCSPGFTPRRISETSSASTSISYTFVSNGTYDAAYDIWLNADNNVTGVQDTEIMIWFNRQGSIQPVGSNTGQSVNISGHSWNVWTGNNGGNNVVSYVSPSAISSASLDVLAFVRDTFSRGSQYGNNSWYLTSIQAGFEPWIGGVGLAVNSFSASVNGGNPPQTTPPQTTPPRTTPPQQTTPPNTGQPGTCSASYRTISSWGSGLQGEVTVRNNGSSSLNGWTVKMTMASGQTINNIWNGVNTGTSGAVTVKNAPYNGTIGANGSVTFGFVATGSSSAPSGLSCTSP